MAMGIVTSDDFELEISKYEPLKKQSESNVVEINKGRPKGRTEIPEELRKVISEESLSGAPAQDVAKAFDISESSISAYKHGATSTATYHSPSESLVKHNERVIGKITSMSHRRIMQAMRHITEEKLKDAKLGELGAIAVAMSNVSKNVIPQAGMEIKQQVVVYAPRLMKESDYESIVVNE